MRVVDAIAQFSSIAVKHVMRRASHSFVAQAVLVPALAVLASFSIHAEEARGPSIYQQRNADGSVVLTDRPSSGAVTQRTWQFAPEEPGAAGRRESARVDAAEVARRIAARLEAEDRQVHELTLARVRAAETRARLDAELADSESQTVWVVGPRAGRGLRGWNVDVATPPSLPPRFQGRPPTVSIVRGIPLRADGFPNR